jgi:hypothetical protein
MSAVPTLLLGILLWPANACTDIAPAARSTARILNMT